MKVGSLIATEGEEGQIQFQIKMGKEKAKHGGSSIKEEVC